ncbi:Syndetin [Halotydeus destructor]|nr:Syndetin [Halotydeus destructor]
MEKKLSKFKTLLNKPSPKGSLENGSASIEDLDQYRIKEPSAVVDPNNLIEVMSSYADEKVSRQPEMDLGLLNPEIENEIMKCISEVYFSNRHPSEFERDQISNASLPEKFDLGYIISEKTRLTKYLSVVSKRQSDLILKRQEEYAIELQRVTELQTTLNETIKMCTRSRQQLRKSGKCLVYFPLNIIGHHLRKEQLRCLIKTLTKVQVLHSTFTTLRKHYLDNHSSSIVPLCFECLTIAHKLNSYSCVTEMRDKLQDIVDSFLC